MRVPTLTTTEIDSHCEAGTVRRGNYNDQELPRARGRGTFTVCPSFVTDIEHDGVLFSSRHLECIEVIVSNCLERRGAFAFSQNPALLKSRPYILLRERERAQIYIYIYTQREGGRGRGFPFTYNFLQDGVTTKLNTGKRNSQQTNM